MNRILIVDDELSMREMLSIMLRKEGYEILTAENGEAALNILQNEIFDLVITDVRMDQVGGIEVLRAVKDLSPETVVIMITAYASTETAVDAMKMGAYDYITKPFRNEEIRMVIRKALEKHLLRKENILLKREIESRAGFENFIGKSEPMQRIFSLIRQVADTRSTVLITGESGTGKELVARAMHTQGARRNHPFISINCSALPETLLESELFGYMKGAFTGAVANKQGLFEAANGGTIFLDEISSTSPALQTKLLRVLQERELRRVGGTSDIKVDVRVIAATNRDLVREVANGMFRDDLYYRLNVIPVALPPLRDRKDDIPLLAEHFLRKNASGAHVKRIAPDVLKLFLAYRWPGNVRELENTIERLAILTPGELITLDHIPGEMKTTAPCPDIIPLDIPESGIDLECILQTAERSLLYRALDKARGVKTEAAKLLGLSFRSFRHRLQKYEKSS
jgi:two-component system, NtrC family, response regulator PilR